MPTWLSDNPRRTALFAILGILLVVLIVKFFGGDSGLPGMTEEMAAAWDSIQDEPEERRPAALRDWINGQNDAISVPALRSMKDAIGSEALPYFAALLRNSDQPGANSAEVRRVTINMIGDVGDRKIDAAPLLRVLNEDDADEVRAQAAKQLGTWHHWEAMPSLIARMRDAESVDLRRRSWQAVHRMIGTDYRYDASASATEREPIVRRLEQDWQGYEPAHKNYVVRKFGDTP